MGILYGLHRGWYCDVCGCNHGPKECENCAKIAELEQRLEVSDADRLALIEGGLKDYAKLAELEQQLSRHDYFERYLQSNMQLDRARDKIAELEQENEALSQKDKSAQALINELTDKIAELDREMAKRDVLIMEQELTIAELEQSKTKLREALSISSVAISENEGRIRQLALSERVSDDDIADLRKYKARWLILMADGQPEKWTNRSGELQSGQWFTHGHLVCIDNEPPQLQIDDYESGIHLADALMKEG